MGAGLENKVQRRPIPELNVADVRITRIVVHSLIVWSFLGRRHHEIRQFGALKTSSAQQIDMFVRLSFVTAL